jgi:hypothetical protein
MAKPRLLGLIHKRTAPGTDDLFDESIVPSYKSSAFRITAILGGNSTLKVSVKGDAADFNASVALVANRVYTFVMGATSNLEYNFRLGSDVTIILLQIDEISSEAL